VVGVLTIRQEKISFLDSRSCSSLSINLVMYETRLRVADFCTSLREVIDKVIKKERKKELDRVFSDCVTPSLFVLYWSFSEPHPSGLVLAVLGMFPLFRKSFALEFPLLAIFVRCFFEHVHRL